MVGLIEPNEVAKSGRRLFDRKNIERIKLVKKLNESGYPLRAIRELFLEGRTNMTRHGEGGNKRNQGKGATKL
jgi:DNA-binding transcriptional MerR regulator